MSFDALFWSYHWFLLIYFYFFARAYINVMRLCAPLFVCWHVCKNREGLETILLQPWCLRYICLRLTINENTWQYLFLALFCVESVQCNHQLKQSWTVYREKWIGRGGPIAWPPRSPDLTPLDFFLWRHVKNVVYINPVNTRQELIEQIFTAFDEIWRSPSMFARVRQAMARRCKEWNKVHGTHFEHLL